MASGAHATLRQLPNPRLPAALGRALRPLLRRAIFGLALGLAAASASAEDGVTSDAVVLGQTGAASGPLSQLNSEYLGGANLYFDRLNQSGGVHGRTIRIVSLDDGYDPQRAAANARQLISNDKVFALFACFGTGPSLQVLPIADAAGVPYFAPYTGADALRDPAFDSAFHIRASYGQEVRKIVEHLTSLGVTAIAVVHHGDAFGTAGLDAARAAMEEKGLAPLVALPIRADGQDAGNVARAVAAANPAAVVMVTAGASSAALVRALSETKRQPMLYGLSVISSMQLISDLGPLAHGLVVSQVVPSPFRFEAAVANEYRQAATQAGMPVGYTGLEGYIAAKVFAEALRRAGNPPTRSALVAGLQTMNPYELGGFAVSFGPRRHSGSTLVDLSVISRGRFTH